ncbi:HupE/UreJ family protein, partial [Neobacillus drentensis]
GHSVTLALASLNVVTLSPSIIEPLIALSIVYVTIENFFVKSLKRRWVLT